LGNVSKRLFGLAPSAAQDATEALEVGSLMVIKPGGALGGHHSSRPRTVGRLAHNTIKRHSPATVSTMAAGIHTGASTHHHDHAITPVNLSVMNTIASRPLKPIPLEDELDWLGIESLLRHEHLVGNEAGHPPLRADGPNAAHSNSHG